MLLILKKENNMKYTFAFLSLSLIICNNAHCFSENQVPITPKKVIQLTTFPHIQRIFKEASVNSESDYSNGIHDFAGLGMGNVPVLDQGQYGTCATFSSTASIDALLQKGDFISQQCSLELDLGLGQNFWNGASYPSQIINPLKDYGVISKLKCPDRYALLSVSLNTDESAEILDAAASAIVKKIQLLYVSPANLDELKKAIDAKHRVLIGFTLDSNSAEAVRGFDIKIAGKKYTGGLWACKQSRSENHCVESNAGHEVLVLGYDDAQQLLKIRNSWNTEVGFKGEYFMTYKFFETMAIDSTEIW
jgi:hypothetical protein